MSEGDNVTLRDRDGDNVKLRDADGVTESVRLGEGVTVAASQPQQANVSECMQGSMVFKFKVARRDSSWEADRCW